MEPSKHQYDFDAQTVIGFIRHYGLEGDFKVNVEANHATLAGHSFAHELQMCADAGLLGSIDANRGDPQNGWDTDQFPVDLYDTVSAMLVVLENGGLHTGGLNFDAKVRRESVDPEDIFIGHIGGMDAFARGLAIAHDLIEQSPLVANRATRYASFDNGDGAAFARGDLGLAALRDIAAANGEPSQHQRPTGVAGKSGQPVHLAVPRKPNCYEYDSAVHGRSGDFGSVRNPERRNADVRRWQIRGIASNHRQGVRSAGSEVIPGPLASGSRHRRRAHRTCRAGSGTANDPGRGITH